jgi:two-component system, NtrC family, sensor kinase
MKLKISYKLIIAVGSVAVAIIGVFAYLILDAHERQLVSELERSAHQLSETVKSSTKYDMLLNQRQSVHRIIETIGQQTGIEKVRIFNKDGAIIYSTDRLDFGKMVDQRTEACYACHAANRPLEKLPISKTTRIFQSSSQGRTLGIINPIYNEPSCWQSACHAHDRNQKVLGVLDITMALAEVDRSIRGSRMRLIIFAIIAIAAISLMIYMLIKSMVLKPVAMIIAATQHVAMGDLHYVITLRKNDEIGELAESFNNMVRKLAETQRQLYQSDKLASIGRLAAGLAHEINNPLTGVLTNSTYLLKRVKDRPEIQDELEVIVRETKRCRDIVKGLLDFARQSKPEKQLCDINEVVSRAIRFLQNQFSLHRIELELNFQPNLPLVKVDVSQMQQVLVNLFINADDAIGESGGRITVSTAAAQSEKAGNGLAPPEGNIQITIMDSGCGIPAEDLSKIFDPFFTTKGQKGNGLGLAMVWGIVEKHEGRISVASKVGEGTTITILLPMNATGPKTGMFVDREVLNAPKA